MARLAELLGGLSLAADTVNGFPLGKVLRTSILGAALARGSGASPEVVRDVYYLAMLRYLGCTGFAYEEGRYFGAGNDHSVRSVMCMADAADPIGTIRAIIARVGEGAPVADRARAVLRLLEPKIVAEHARAQTDTATRISRVIGLSSQTEAALLHICERWDGKGAPEHQAGDALALAMRFHHVADIAEIAHHREGRDGAKAVIGRRSGAQLDPRICESFLADVDALCAPLEAAEVWQTFLEAEPMPASVMSPDQEDRVCFAVGLFVDLKSVYTLGHSSGVARLAGLAATSLGLDPGEVRALIHAGHLHDVGKLAIPNSVWERPGPLDLGGFEKVRQHAYFTERILAQAPALAPAAKIATLAHERLDGRGYHRALPGSLIPMSARVLAAADVVHALSEDRPHRPAHRSGQVVALARSMAVSGALDATAVEAVLAAAELIAQRARSVWPKGLSDREIEVLRLVARGKTNKEIGALLGISARTAQNHVAHIYDKIGVYSRAGAALYVMEEGLLGPDL